MKARVLLIPLLLLPVRLRPRRRRASTSGHAADAAPTQPLPVAPSREVGARPASVTALRPPRPVPDPSRTQDTVPLAVHAPSAADRAARTIVVEPSRVVSTPPEVEAPAEPPGVEADDGSGTASSLRWRRPSGPDAERALRPLDARLAPVEGPGKTGPAGTYQVPDALIASSRTRRRRFLLLLLALAAVAVGAAAGVYGLPWARVDGAVERVAFAPEPSPEPSPVATPQAAPPAPQPSVSETVPEPDPAPELAAVQQQLTDLHYYVGEINGESTPAFRSALMAFQKVHGLVADGVLGPASLAALEAPRAPELRGGEADRIEVDLTLQVLYLVKGGDLIRILPVSSGSGETYRTADGGTARSLTPVGTYRIERTIRGVREADLGTLYDPLYFYRGWAIHGSNSVPAVPASHGCVRVTRADATWLFNRVRIDTQIILYGGTHTFAAGSTAAGTNTPAGDTPEDSAPEPEAPVVNPPSPNQGATPGTTPAPTTGPTPSPVPTTGPPPTQPPGAGIVPAPTPDPTDPGI